jgi:hypothetical protein
MNYRTDIRCWEIIKCDKQDCPARHEPETPCWEIAKREGAYKAISNICIDCIVYVLKEKTDFLGRKEKKKILSQKRVALLDCSLRSTTKK